MASEKGSTIPPVPDISNLSLRTEQRRRPLPMMFSAERSPEKTEEENVAHPLSPAVISSLISSLSAISTPVENHFNSLPTVDENWNTTSSKLNGEWSSSPSPILRGAHSPSRPNGFGMDYGAYNSIAEEEQGSNIPIDDAAMPPVIRFVKPSSSSTSLSRAVPPSPRGLTFRKSLQSLRSREDLTSIGIVNPEQPLKSSSASIASSTRSTHSRFLRLRSSKDTLRNSETPSALRNGVSVEDNGVSIFGRAATSLRPTLSNRSLTEGITREATGKAETLKLDTGAFVTKSSSSTLATSSPIESTNSISVNNGAIVPSRRSSLRHSISGSPRIKQMHPGRKRHSSGSRELKDLNIDPDLIEEDHQTVRRIRELQEAKERRERETRRESRKSDRSKSRSSIPGPQAPLRTTSRSPRPGADGSAEGENRELKNEENMPAASAVPVRVQAKRSSTEPLRVSAGNVQNFSRKPLLEHNGELENGLPLRRHSTKISPLRHNRTFSTDSGKKVRSGRTSGAFDRPSSINSIEDGVEAYLKSPRLTQRVRHPQTGRVIAFSEVGDPNGFAVFCCVGMGLTRYLTAFYDELARTLRLRLITPDRPGIGESEACFDGTGTPMGWSDDVTIICSHLGISKFSLLAHSAGAVYALATALRMPQHVRGRLHLMAPWIPPSQMTSIGASQKELLPAANVPYSQKLLRMLPASFLKAANSSFLTARSASLTKQSPRPKASKRRSTGPEMLEAPFRNGVLSAPEKQNTPSPLPGQRNGNTAQDQGTLSGNVLPQGTEVGGVRPDAQNSGEQEAAIRRSAYDELLTQSIWDHAVMNANPAVDLITCLERRQPIGFRYVEITRSVVIYHGSKDTRVPVDNVKWLGKMMRRCEVRILEGEGHGLMANASVMGTVLAEVAKEWEDWWNVTQGKGERKRRDRGETS